MKQNDILSHLQRGWRIVNNGLVSTTGDTHRDTITTRQIKALEKKQLLSKTTNGPFHTYRLK